MVALLGGSSQCLAVLLTLISFSPPVFLSSCFSQKITRNGVTAEGRLAYNLTEGPSANPRWLVKFDRESWKDEELYERSFGALLRKAGDEADRASAEDYPNKQSKRTSKSSSSSEEDSSKGTSNKRKGVTFSESSPVGSDSSSIENDQAAVDERARARAQRIARRQAKIDKEVTQPKPRSRDPRGNKRTRVEESNEEVIKVPMKTGTLYLYRGLNRRAEFVRKC
jgi:hypothetical protein